MEKLASVKESVRPEKETRSERKRKAILDAATEVFLNGGYLGTNMDEIASLAAVSKQTVYKHFASKEALFTEIVSGMTGEAEARIHSDVPELSSREEVAEYLQDYGYKQLSIVLTPPLMQLRRLVIGEVSRFPQLGKALYEGGPKRAVTALAAAFERLASRGLLVVDDPFVAASHFNWLVMAEPLNQVMMMGDGAVPTQAELCRHVAEGVRVFLAAYGKR
jgi:TetR/AcrR family transcriptional regulator, mexJK operon transcriptional repressor